MDAQLKRGLIEICILGLLARGDSYGYQLVKDIDPILPLSESTLYPVLRRLETAQCLRVYSVAHQNRLRRYYAITETGRQRIRDFMAEWAQMRTVYSFLEETLTVCTTPNDSGKED